MTYRSYGDSITTGTGATSFANSYLGLLQTDLGVTFSNQAVSTSMAMDQATALYSIAASSGDVTTIMLGTNDQAKYNTDATKLDYYVKALRAFGIYTGAVTTPATPANGVSYTAGWITGGYAWSSYGSTTVGSTATFSATGNTIALGMICQYPNASTFSVTIDGVNKGTFATGAADMKTILNRAYGPMCLAFTGLGAGSHTVVITVVNGGTQVYLQWFSVLTPKSGVVYVNTPYAVNYTIGGSDANVDTYNAALASLVTELSGYGLTVSLADANSVLVKATDMADNVHPNNAGHLKIRNKVYTAITGNASPVLLTACSIYFGSDGNYWVNAGGVKKQVTVV